MRRFANLLFLVLLVVTTTATAAADSDPPPDPDDPITVELLTMGPGDHPFFKFGHNAIRVRDASKGTDVVYNYGTFSFTSPTLIQDFFKGRLQYWLSRESMAGTLAHYAGEDRSLFSQRLALSPRQKVALKRQLEQNARPQNRAYKYDYFFDNCSTRVRDAIDRVAEGRLRQAMSDQATQSLRDHALRSTADYFLEYLVLSIGLGPVVDRPTDRWAEAFLPEMLTEGIRLAKIPAADGAEQPLVAEEKALLEHRDERLARPPRWTGRFALVGVLCGAVLVLLAWLARRLRASAVVLGTSIAAVGFVAGALGLALVALWGFTDHAVAYRNQNILLLSPLAMGLVFYGVRTAMRGLVPFRALRWLSMALVASAAVALLLKLVPFEYQDNGTLIAFFLPFWTGLHVAVLLARRLVRSTALPSVSAAAPASAQPTPDDSAEFRAGLAPGKLER